MFPLYISNPYNNWSNNVRSRFPGQSRLPMNIRQTDKAFEITFQLTADVDPSKITIELEHDELVIKYQSSERDSTESKDEQSSWIRKEFWQDESFARSFELPKEVDSENITAQIKSGLLTVTLPIKPKSEKRTVSIAQV